MDPSHSHIEAAACRRVSAPPPGPEPGRHAREWKKGVSLCLVNADNIVRAYIRPLPKYAVRRNVRELMSQFALLPRPYIVRGNVTAQLRCVVLSAFPARNGSPPVARSIYPLRCISGQADQRRTRAAASEGPRPILSPLFRAALRPEASPVSGGDRPCGKSGAVAGRGGTQAQGESCVPLWDQLTGRRSSLLPLTRVWGWGRQRGRAILTLFLPHATGRLSSGERFCWEMPWLRP